VSSWAAARSGLKAARSSLPPSFHDYLYVSLTDSLAFSPTDTLACTGAAKVVMGVESVMSFAIVGVQVARAVNIAIG